MEHRGRKGVLTKDGKARVPWFKERKESIIVEKVQLLTRSVVEARKTGDKQRSFEGHFISFFAAERGEQRAGRPRVSWHHGTSNFQSPDRREEEELAREEEDVDILQANFTIHSQIQVLSDRE